MNLTIGTITAPRPRPTLGRTIRELRAAGFSQTIHIFAEPESQVERQPGTSVRWNAARLGLWRNWHHAATTLLHESDADYLLICEDDLRLARGAAACLQQAIEMLPAESWGFASLYTPRNNVRNVAAVAGWQAVDEPSHWGALAYCFHRRSLSAILHSRSVLLHTGAEGTDLVVSAAAHELGRRAYFHVPSLCAHAGAENSSVGHPALPGMAAVDFQPELAVRAEATRRGNGQTHRHGNGAPARNGAAVAPAPVLSRRAIAAPEPIDEEAAAPSGKIRVGFVMPKFTMGGVAQGRLLLARHMDPTRFEFTGMALLWGKGFCPERGARLKRHMPIYSTLGQQQHFAPSDVVTCLPTLEEVLAAVSRDADVLWIWGVESIADRLARVLSGLPTSCRVLLSSHGGSGCHWTRKMLRTLAPLATDYLAVSQESRKAFPEELHSAVEVIYNGVDLNRITPSLGRGAVRRAWGLADRHRAIGFLGRFSADKNPLALARAVRRLGGDYRAVYVGDGDNRQGVQGDVRRLAGDRALVLPQREQIGDVLAGLDVLVLASPSEGCAHTLLEAWQAGLPVVSTRVGIVDELEREHGRLVRSIAIDPTPEELAAAIEMCFNAPDEQIAVRARDLAWNRFSASRCVEETERFLAKIARKPAGKVMKIGFLLPSLYMGGSGRWVAGLAKSFDPRQVLLSGAGILSLQGLDRLTARELSRYMPLYGREDDPAADSALAANIEFRPTARDIYDAVSDDADVLIVLGDVSPMLPSAAGLARRVLVGLGNRRSHSAARMLADMTPRCTDFVAVSHSAAAAYPESLRPRVTLLPNAADPGRCVATIPRDVTRARWGLSSEHIVVGFIGRFHHEKNPCAAAHAAAVLGGPFRAVLVGSGIEEEQIRADAARIAGDRAVFVPQYDQIGNALAAIDVLIHASPAEGFPQLLIEAWLAEVPVVATAVEPLADLEADHGRLTVRVPFDPAPDQLADAVRQALRPETAETTRRARQVALEKLTWRHVADQWTGYLAGLLQENEIDGHVSAPSDL